MGIRHGVSSLFFLSGCFVFHRLTEVFWVPCACKNVMEENVTVSAD